MAAQAQIRRVGFGGPAYDSCVSQMVSYGFSPQTAAEHCRATTPPEYDAFYAAGEAENRKAAADQAAANADTGVGIDWSKLVEGAAAGLSSLGRQMQGGLQARGLGFGQTAPGYLPGQQPAAGKSSWVLPVGIGVGVLAVAALALSLGGGKRTA